MRTRKIKTGWKGVDRFVCKVWHNNRLYNDGFAIGLTTNAQWQRRGIAGHLSVPLHLAVPRTYRLTDRQARAIRDALTAALDEAKRRK